MQPLRIIEATRGHVTVQCGDKTVTVWGELLGQSPGLPDYQLYGDALKTWDKPTNADNVYISQEEKDAILTAVCNYLRNMGRIPVVLG